MPVDDLFVLTVVAAAVAVVELAAVVIADDYLDISEPWTVSPAAVLSHAEALPS